MPQRWYHRKSPRLQGYDYSREGAYFVTACVRWHHDLFGHVADGEMHLNPAGVMVADYWGRIPTRFPSIDIDAAVVMPNHFHGIVVLESGGKAALDRVMHWFKLEVTKAYGRGVKQNGWTAYDGQLWQRSYYDHIVRDEADLARIRTYIVDNPVRWQDKLFNE